MFSSKSILILEKLSFSKSDHQYQALYPLKNFLNLRKILGLKILQTLPIFHKTYASNKDFKKTTLDKKPFHIQILAFFIASEKF